MPKSTALQYQLFQKYILVGLEQDWAQRERIMIIPELEAPPTFEKNLVQNIAAHEGFALALRKAWTIQPRSSGKAGDSDDPSTING